MTEVAFTYEGVEYIIQCKQADKMRDIIDKLLIKINKNIEDLYFLYNGNKINYELTFLKQANDLDRNRNKMNIIVYNTENEPDLIKTKLSKDIICPKCFETIFINFKDFKINLSGCKQNHTSNNILLDKFEETQKIILNNIICQKCNQNNKSNTHNNDFYICNTCNKNICPICKSLHDQEHMIINYDDKNYICKKHNESFIKYCKDCNEDICMICDNEHTNHNLFDLSKILINKTELLKTMENLKNVIDLFKLKIEMIKEILNKMVNTLNIYYKMNETIIHNYNQNKRNYHKLVNLNSLKKNNEILAKDINDLIVENKITKIYDYSIDKYYNEKGEKYFGCLKNGLKEGKGILYYDEEDEFNRKKYEGEFKNDKIEGKGILYWNNGNRFEGNFIGGQREGNGILYYNNGDRFEGFFKNDK